MGNPLTSTLITIDGSLVMAIGLAAFLVAGVLFSAAMRRRWTKRRLVLRPVAHWRRAAV